MEEDFATNGHAGASWKQIIGGVVVGTIIGGLLFGTPSKYEDMTAEEWFNEYDHTVSCLEKIRDTADNYQDESYSNMNDALYEISSKASSCI